MTIELPSGATASVIAIVGATGSGKTFTAKGLLEPPLSAGARVCVIDPTGALLPR